MAKRKYRQRWVATATGCATSPGAPILDSCKKWSPVAQRMPLAKCGFQKDRARTRTGHSNRRLNSIKMSHCGKSAGAKSETCSPSQAAITKSES